MNITGGGVVEVASGTGAVVLGTAASGTGTLNIGTGGVAGELLAAEVTSGPGGGFVNFNHTGTQVFLPLIKGTLAVDKLGANTAVFTGSFLLEGGTTISAGTLQLGEGGARRVRSLAMSQIAARWPSIVRTP